MVSTGKAKGFVGHHINSVKGYPRLADRPHHTCPST
ncbi:hypothetical protein AB1284_25240 [Bacillus sp. S2(2024)]